MDQYQRNAARFVIANCALALASVLLSACMTPQLPRDVNAQQIELLQHEAQLIKVRVRFYHDQKLTFSATACQPALVEVEQGRLLLQAPSRPSLLLEPSQKARAAGVESLSIDAVKTTIATILFSRDESHSFANANDWRNAPDGVDCIAPEHIGLFPAQ